MHVERGCGLRDVAHALSCRDRELWLLSHQGLHGIETLLHVIDVKCDLLTELINLFLEVFEASGAFELQLVLQADALLPVLHERIIGFDAFLYVPLDASLLLLPVFLELLLKLAYPRETRHSL
jgi:hypothetical protein